MANDKSLDNVQPFSELFSDFSLSGKESMVNQIHAILWELITTTKLLPGQLLSEKELSEALNASRTPVREALIRLEDAGLVYVIPKSGTYVTPVRISTYIEACFIRIQLETGAVRRATERFASYQSDEDLSGIIKRQKAALKEDDYSKFFQLDELLHQAIFTMAGLPGVWDVMRRTQSEVYRIRHLKREFQLRHGAKVLKAHQNIVDCIKAGDPDASEAAMIDHLGPLEREIEQLTAFPELLKFIEQQNADTPRSRRRSSK
ncbi:GntR family transcriptional regulator [Granulosicoccus antarcticus]|uniref:HTH-type transcriptional repressor RspR n=1 Tax=Granulosicoccus antarcticus IMCC3135 TaxID=1192854 RepID=A0A2Z2NRS6_9GAMM|nr:GntR family transcriptional regulator [Granulosicoccus antarcticus]ASJ74073.1 HTH-type transcriptional repressor RspR [Granulosicoccus antarcticus IMCC3135]